MTRHIQATWVLLFATLIWGASFPLTHALAEVQQERAPLASTFFLAAVTVMARFGVSGAILLLFSPRNAVRPTRLEMRQGLGMAIFASGGLIFQIDGLYHTTASISAFLTQSYCALIPVWLAIKARQWPRPVVIGAVILVLAGVARLSGVDWNHFQLGRGEIETLISSVFFAGQILWLERPIFSKNRPQTMSIIMFMTIAVLMLVLGLATTRAASDWTAALTSPAIYWLQGVLTIACTLFTFTAMNAWQPFVSATEAGLIYCLEPVCAAVFALFLPGWLSERLAIHSVNEVFTPNLIAGGALILGANVLVQLFPGKKVT